MVDELDGVQVAPRNHKVLFENDSVRVLETIIEAGEVTPVHTHHAPQVMYVVSPSSFIRRDEHGVTMVDTKADPNFVLPKVLWSPGLGRHSIENTGVDALVVIGVELKTPVASDTNE
jgi:hypothetical protein